MILTPEQWLKRPGLFRCILVEADYLLNGELNTLYLSNVAYRALPSDTQANQIYKNWLNNNAVLSFSQRMSVALFGETQTGTSAIEFFLHPLVESLIINADFSGQALRVFVGDRSWPRDLFIEKFVGHAKSLDPVDNLRARLVFADKSESLKKGALTNVIAGSANNDEFKPRCLGKCFNIEPKLIDEVNRVYLFNDGASQAVTAVRESGFLISTSDYIIDLNNSTVTINRGVSGRITLDAQGHVEIGVYLSTAEQFINYFLSLLGENAAIDVDVLPTYELGLYIREQTNVIDLIDDICLSVGGNWFFDALAQCRLQHYNGISIATNSINKGKIEKGSMRIKERLPAVKQLTLGYQRNWTEQKDGLAAAITENSPELAELYSKKQSVVTDSNLVANPTAAIEESIDTLIVNKADAQTELTRQLALSVNPRTIFECKTIIKKHEQGSTVNLSYPRYFSTENNNAKDVMVVGHVHRINSTADVLEVLA